MESASSKTSTLHRTSLTNIVQNWMATLFAYQPEVYFQLDEYRRKLSLDFVSPEMLQDQLIRTGLLKVQTDSDNPMRLVLKLDADVFTRARGKFWSVIVRKNGEEFEFVCADEVNGKNRAALH